MKLYPNITYIISIFIIWLLSILVIFYLGFSTLPHSRNFDNNFWQSLGNWDGGHFLGIAEVGYSQKFQYAFFPLYPFTIQILHHITKNFLVAAVLISLVSTFFGLHLLYKLVLLDFDKRKAEKTVLAFLFFPTSFYLLTAYSEGLFFFLAVLTFYFLRKNKLFWATIVASLASATRLVGLAVVAGLLVEVIIRQGLNRKNWFVLMSPLGFFIYCFFLYKQTGDPFYFIKAENHWQRVLVAPGTGFWETISNLSSGGFISSNFSIFLDLIFAVFGVGFAIRAFRFLPSSFAVYGLISIGTPLLTPTLSSMPRFLLVIFPLFILVASVKNRFFQQFFQVFSIMLLAIFSVLFITGYWVS